MKTVDFSETIEVCDLKVGRSDFFKKRSLFRSENLKNFVSGF